jgi:hypothetical protein
MIIIIGPCLTGGPDLGGIGEDGPRKTGQGSVNGGGDKGGIGPCCITGYTGYTGSLGTVVVVSGLPVVVVVVVVVVPVVVPVVSVDSKVASDVVSADGIAFLFVFCGQKKFLILCHQPSP